MRAKAKEKTVAGMRGGDGDVAEYVYSTAPS